MESIRGLWNECLWFHQKRYVTLSLSLHIHEFAHISPETEILSAESAEAINVSSLKPGVGHSTALQASPNVSSSSFLISAFSILSSSFPLLTSSHIKRHVSAAMTLSFRRVFLMGMVRTRVSNSVKQPNQTAMRWTAESRCRRKCPRETWHRAAEKRMRIDMIYRHQTSWHKTSSSDELTQDIVIRQADIGHRHQTSWHRTSSSDELT